MVEAQHGGKVFGRQVWGGLHGDVGIGIGRVAHNQHFDVTVGHFVQCRALNGKDGGISLQQVGTFHAFAARTGADQNGDLRIFKGDFGVVGGKHIDQEREGAVLQFHHHAFNGILSLRQIQQLQDNGLIFAQHFTAGNTEQQGITDLAGSTGYGNTNG